MHFTHRPTAFRFAPAPIRALRRWEFPATVWHHRDKRWRFGDEPLWPSSGSHGIPGLCWSGLWLWRSISRPGCQTPRMLSLQTHHTQDARDVHVMQLCRRLCRRSKHESRRRNVLSGQCRPDSLSISQLQELACWPCPALLFSPHSPSSTAQHVCSRAKKENMRGRVQLKSGV